MRVRVVVLCLIGMSRTGRPDPERAGDRQTEPYPGIRTELYRGGFVQKAEVTSLSGVHSAIHYRNNFFI